MPEAKCTALSLAEKLEPVMVTVAPTAAEDGAMLAMEGEPLGGVKTVGTVLVDTAAEEVGADATGAAGGVLVGADGAGAGVGVGVDVGAGMGVAAAIAAHP